MKIGRIKRRLWKFYEKVKFNEMRKILFDHNFTGIITFQSDSSFKQIPRLARDIGFKGVIVGIKNDMLITKARKF